VAYAGTAGAEEALQEALQQHWDALQAEAPLLPVDWEGMYERITAAETATPVVSISSPLPLYKRRWWAVAALLLLAAGGTWLWVGSGLNNLDTKKLAVQPVAPGHSGAVLTLADGTQVVLDSTANGQVAQQANAVVTKQNGQLVYSKIGEAAASSDKPLLNTLSTPRGRHYQLVLPDGTTAWLNAGSSIQYPAVFGGSDRRVIITGEVYFEVAAKANAPFIVVTPKQEITVLGTGFNINAYSNEAAERTTLLSGRIKVAAGSNGVVTDSKILQPGRQALLHANGHLNVEEVEAEQYIAWVKNLFWFNHASVPDVMRQLERWYDIEVTYEGTVPQHDFGGKLQRSLPLAEVLQLLEKSGVYCKVEGRRVTVLSQKQH
jgi:ferric-dicitrate binding protein FerR (iron transport regulator)